jgi:hypothetical protein
MAERGRSSSISGVMPLLQTNEHHALGITPVLKEYVKMLCEHPSTWIDFPLAAHLKEKSKNRKHRSTSNLGGKPPTLPTSPTPPPPPDNKGPETKLTENEQHITSTTTTTAAASTTSSQTPEQSTTSTTAAPPTPSTPPMLETSPPSPVTGDSVTRSRRQPVVTRMRSKSETAATITASLHSPPSQLPPPSQPARTESTLMSWFSSFLNKPQQQQQTTPRLDELIPVPTVKDPGDGWHMTKKQRQHAVLLLKEIPQLMGMRQQLVPKHLSEDTFWRIYFLLVSNKLGHILEEDDESDEEDNYDRTKPAKHASSWNLCHRSSFAQLFSGQSKVTFEDTPTLPISGFYPWWRANSKGSKDEEQYFATKTPGMIAKEVNFFFNLLLSLLFYFFLSLLVLTLFYCRQRSFE